VRQLIANREGKEAIENLDPNRLMRPAAVAETYWQLYQQPRDAWTFETEIRPFGEKW
jgi:NADP-dependent 3-hydroxy acid dehydrogenase YdfG